MSPIPRWGMAQTNTRKPSARSRCASGSYTGVIPIRPVTRTTGLAAAVAGADCADRLGTDWLGAEGVADAVGRGRAVAATRKRAGRSFRTMDPPPRGITRRAGDAG